MDEITNQNKRRTIRLDGYDYTACGAYFVTICSHEKRCVFGRVHDSGMRLNVYGEIVRDEWLRTSNVRTNVTLDEYVVMPNHFHGILIITNDPCRGLARQAPTVPQFAKPQPDSLGTIIGAFKSAVTRRINTHRTERNLPIVHVWQRNYYERIIRDEKELFNTRRYIIENPMNWANDENHPNR